MYFPKNLGFISIFKYSLFEICPLFCLAESPNNVMIQRVGDAAKEIIAAAGEDLELECIATGANPPAKLTWIANGQEIASSDPQEDKRQGENQRTWTSFSRLTLPVSKEDNGASIECVATHPAMNEPLSAEKPLTIHCKCSKLSF